jgi:hypothetical protein
MLAGMQLDVFAPLRDGPITPQQIANALETLGFNLTVIRTGGG